MTIELRGFELDMHTWLRKHAPEEVATFEDLLADRDMPTTAGVERAHALYDSLRRYQDTTPPLDLFPGAAGERLGGVSKDIEALSIEELQELVRLAAMRYAVFACLQDIRLGRQLLYFNAFHKAYNEVHSDSAVRRREQLAVDGWHGRICVIYPTDKNPQALLNAYRQGQNAKRDGRECGCSACVEEARRVLEASVNHADEKFEYQEMKRKQGFDEVTVTVDAPVPAFPATDDEIPF